jgi:hypothetical protein
MYTHCFICRHALGENTSIPHLPVGSKIAFDGERGRLWVVCPRCGQWCLTPMEDRWEALAECEALFTRAEARVSSKGIGVARDGDVELIRIGPALRDEIANWRYGPRFARRRRRARIVGGMAAVAAGAIAGVALYEIGTLAVATESAFVGGWLAMLGTVYVAKLRSIPALRPVAQLTLPDGSHRTLRRKHLPVIRLSRFHTMPQVRLQVPYEDLTVTYTEDDALELLGRVLPHSNWSGASPDEIALATVRVDRAEAAGGRAWERLVPHARGRTADLMTRMPVVDRLALEMAVTEELERRAMSGQATALAERWVEEEEIARTADEMFLPGWIGEWIRSARRQISSRQGER